MAIQRIMVLLCNPPIPPPFSFLSQSNSTDASVSFKGIAESSINHCLVPAHLPLEFCIPRHRFQSVPPNWGAWQSGTIRQAAPSIWQGGQPHSKANPAKKKRRSNWGQEERKGEAEKGCKNWRLSFKGRIFCVCFRLYFLPFANNFLLTSYNSKVWFTFAVHIQIYPLKKTSVLLQRRKKKN